MRAARDWARRHARWSAVVMAVVLVVVTGVLLTVVRDLVDGSSFHPASQFAGSDAGFRAILGGDARSLSEGDVYASLAVDSGLAVLYGFGLWLFLWTWWCPPFWKVLRVLNLRRTVLVLPVIAAVFDVLENIVTAFGLEWTDGVRYRGDGWALAVATLAWIKWFALAGALIAAVVCLVAVLLPRADRAVEPPAVVRMGHRPDPGLGICCSGGGIRAAGYTAGALRALEDAGVLGQADLIAAVSGGAYVAGAYASLGGASVATNARDVARFLEGSDWADLPSGDEPPAPHHRYLENDPGGLVLALVRAAVSVLFNVVVVATVTIAVAWPVGRFFASRYVDPDLRSLRAESVQWDTVFQVPARLWLPAALVLALALGVLVVSAVVQRGSAKVARFGLRIAAGGAVLALLVIVPWALAGAHWFIDQAERGTLATVAIAGVTIGGIAGAVWRVAAKPLAKAAPRLGGVLLAIVLIVFAGWVATDAATQQGWFRSTWLWVGFAAGLALGFLVVDIQWFSMRLMYRSKLRRSFALRRTAGFVPERRTGALEPVDDHQAQWSDDAIVRARPELLICATAQQIGLSGNGIPAESFTISAREVSIGDTVVSTSEYLAALPSGLAKERTIASWQATTGAAFSSAMGRFGYGSTNALLAALNIDLGAWLPNPRLVLAGYRGFPRVRLPFIAKEIFGVYDNHGDEYVFVADGGQWENLGLVELLRRRCRTIICVDAGGDTPGTFRTLLQAIDLAGTELAGEAKIEVDLRDLRSLPDALAKTDVACWPITYADRSAPGRLLYAKAQVSSEAGLDLKRYAKTDHTFPHYSTARQLLSDDQFRALVTLGTEAGHRLAALQQQPADPVLDPPVPDLPDLAVHVVGFDHVVLNVADLERSLSFYCGELGLTPARVDEWRRGEAPFPSARVNDNTVIDFVAAPRTGENANHVCLVVAPTDFDALKASGRFEVTDGPGTRWGAQGNATSLYISDPDGNTVELRYYD